MMAHENWCSPFFFLQSDWWTQKYNSSRTRAAFRRFIIFQFVDATEISGVLLLFAALSPLELLE